VDDIDIIRRVKAGDAESFSFLVEKYHKHLLNFIYGLLRDEKNVEDIGQEVFLNIYRSLRNFDELRGTPFSAWLFISARNRCVSELRKRRDQANVPIEEVPGLRDRSKSAEEMLVDREREALLASSLQQLEEPYRSSILLSLRGDSLEEIAVRQQVSIGTVKSRLFRARKKIRQFLRDHLGGKGYERI
jgi:RNA polymerase sigma-70 factor (ECF subfamily)